MTELVNTKERNKKRGGGCNPLASKETKYEGEASKHPEVVNPGEEEGEDAGHSDHCPGEVEGVAPRLVRHPA